jgi:hypothetical protein
MQSGGRRLGTHRGRAGWASSRDRVVRCGVLDGPRSLGPVERRASARMDHEGEPEFPWRISQGDEVCPVALPGVPRRGLRRRPDARELQPGIVSHAASVRVHDVPRIGGDPAACDGRAPAPHSVLRHVPQSAYSGSNRDACFGRSVDARDVRRSRSHGRQDADVGPRGRSLREHVLPRRVVAAVDGSDEDRV